MSTADPATGQSPTASSIITAAMSQIGVKYVYGGEAPGQDFDCSGLTQWVYSTVGITLPRTSEEQYKATTQVSSALAKPGDLVFMAGSDGTATNPGHVGIYLGGGQFIDAPFTGAVVRIDSVPSDATYGQVSGVAQDAASVGGVSTSPSPTTATGGIGCAGKGDIFSVVGISFSYCQAKALVSGLCIGLGGSIMMTGTLITVAWGLGHTVAGRGAVQAAKAVTPVGRAVGAVGGSAAS
jgi:hypothetical protein